MRYWPILILVAICGCAGSPPIAPISRQYPVVAGDVEVMISDDGTEITAPPGSATAGSKWIKYTVIYKNISDRPIWITGGAETNPFPAIETRTNEDGEWRDYGPYYCGSGLQDFEIAPNASHVFVVELPQGYVGQQFRVPLQYRTARDSRQWVQAASEPHRRERPPVG